MVTDFRGWTMRTMTMMQHQRDNKYSNNNNHSIPTSPHSKVIVQATSPNDDGTYSHHDASGGDDELIDWLIDWLTLNPLTYKHTHTGRVFHFAEATLEQLLQTTFVTQLKLPDKDKRVLEKKYPLPSLSHPFLSHLYFLQTTTSTSTTHSINNNNNNLIPIPLQGTHPIQLHSFTLALQGLIICSLLSICLSTYLFMTENEMYELCVVYLIRDPLFIKSILSLLPEWHFNQGNCHDYHNNENNSTPSSSLNRESCIRCTSPFTLSLSLFSLHCVLDEDNHYCFTYSVGPSTKVTKPNYILQFSVTSHSHHHHHRSNNNNNNNYKSTHPSSSSSSPLLYCSISGCVSPPRFPSPLPPVVVVSPASVPYSYPSSSSPLLCDYHHHHLRTTATSNTNNNNASSSYSDHSHHHQDRRSTATTNTTSGGDIEEDTWSPLDNHNSWMVKLLRGELQDTFQSMVESSLHSYRSGRMD